MRPFEDADFKELYEIHSDEETVRYHIHEVWTPENAKKAFKQRTGNKTLTPESYLNLAVVLDGVVIGDLGATFIGMKETVEIAYTFNKKYQGSGYASEAVRALIDYIFSHFKVHRIVANIDVRNEASSRLCERVGMRKEAHFIQDFWVKGEWTDSYIYAVLANEFEKERELK
ncbi:GNAT family N-acetyltransferase [Aerococcaceae bacterium 50-4]